MHIFCHSASCSDDFTGSITAYSDDHCGEVSKVTDHSQCHKESEHEVFPGLSINIYAEIEECAHEAKTVVHSGNLKNQIMWMIFGVSSIALFALCGGIALCCCIRKRKKLKLEEDEELGSSLMSKSSGSSHSSSAHKVTCEVEPEAVTLE